MLVPDDRAEAFGGFAIANFSDHDDIGIGTEEGAHRGSEIEAYFRIDLHLTQPALGNFNWIFCRPYFALRSINDVKRGMKGGCFS